MTGADVHRGVLDSLLDGVLVVGADGRIETLNPTAKCILGLEPGEADGGGFAELFIAREGLDQFTELVLGATAQEAEPGRHVIEVEGAGGTRSLSVATSYMRPAGGDGASGQAAVVAVFSDITEIRDLRETELRLAKAAEEQHSWLQDAYREIEDRNAALAAALRKVRVAQGAGILLVFGLFLGVGLRSWRGPELSFDLLAELRLPGFGGEAEAVSVGGDGEAAPNTVTVKPRRNSTGITLKGRLSPWREAEVKSPVEGAVAAVGFEIGQQVSEGQVLLELDLSKLERKYQSRRLAFVKAEEQFSALKDWEKSPEMLKARRSFTKAQMNMDSRRSELRKSKFLFEQGLIAAAEFEDAERQHRSQRLDFETAKEEFEATRQKADEKALAAAQLSMDNARAAMAAAGEELKETVVRAPFSGTALPPVRGARDLVEGAKLRKGDVLLRVADFSRIAAASTADEIDVVKLKAGQKMTVAGTAFPDLKIQGVLRSVSAEADPRKKHKAVFNESFLLDELDAAARARIKSGMSAKLRIVTYDNPKALLVPLAAVRRKAGKHWLRVLGEDGEIGEREVEIGPTTGRRVEIASGLKPGERVVVPDR